MNVLLQDQDEVQKSRCVEFTAAPLTASIKTHLIYRRRYKDSRTMRDQVQKHIDGFNLQMDGLVAAYMQWLYELGEKDLGSATPPPPSPAAQGNYHVQVLDVFSTCLAHFSQALALTSIRS